MNKKNYIVPEVQRISLCLPKNVCDGPDQGTDPTLFGGASAIGADPAPGRVRLYN